MKYIISSFFILFFLLSFNLCSQDSFGKIFPIKGIPVIKGNPAIQVTKPLPLKIKDKIATDGVSFAKVVYNDGTVLKLMPNSEITFHKSFLRMKKGNVFYNFKKQGQKFKIFVPAVLVGVYGTKFSINVINDNTAEVALFSGSVDAKALYGNKKKVKLTAGNMLIATRDGILKGPMPIKKSIHKTWQKFKILGYKSSNKKGSSAEKKDKITEKPAVDEESELDTNGDIKYSIIPWANGPIDSSFKVLINGCSSHNGKPLIGKRNQSLRLNDLEADTYDFEIFINGTKHSFTVDIDDSKNGFCQKIPYIKNVIELKIIGKNEYIVMKELEDQKFSAILHSEGEQKKLNIFHDGHFDIKEGADNLLWSRRKFFFNYPEESSPPSIEFIYSGDIEVKDKKIMLQFNDEKNKFNVKFE